MYIQCKVYIQICRKWRAYNRTIVVQVKIFPWILINFVTFKKDLPEDVIKKERKKIISTRKPGKEIEAYLSDPELGNLEVKGYKLI